MYHVGTATLAHPLRLAGLNTFERHESKLLRDCFGALRILIHTPTSSTLSFAIHARDCVRIRQPNNADTIFPCSERAQFAHSCSFLKIAGGFTACVKGKAWMAISSGVGHGNHFSLSKRSVRFASMAAPSLRQFHGFDGRQPTTGTSKRMSCLGLLTFTTPAGGRWRTGGARNRFVGAFIASTATQAGRHDQRWPMSFAAMCARCQGLLDVNGFLRGGNAPRQNAAFRHSGFRNIVESTIEFLLPQTPSPPPISNPFLPWQAKAAWPVSSPANRTEILLCLTGHHRALPHSLCISSIACSLARLTSGVVSQFLSIPAKPLLSTR